MKKIAFINYHMGKGGVEKNILILSNKFIEMGYEVDLILFDNIVEYKGVKSNIISFKNQSNQYIRNLKQLEFEKPLFSKIIDFLPLFLFLKKSLSNKKYDLIISNQEFPNFLSVISGFNVCVTVHNNVKLNTNSFFLNFLLKYIYKFKNVIKVITVSEGIRDYIIENYNYSSNKISHIYNPLELFKVTKLSNEPILEKLPKKYIISIGRLSYQKNQFLLIDAYIKSEVNKKLIILGDGELREELQKYINKFNQQQNIILLGNKDNVFNYLKNAEYFVFSSRYEGFGNVLIESLSVNTPILSNDCDYGPREIIRDNNGVLVKYNNITDFIDKLNYFDVNYKKYIKNIDVSRYDVNKVILEWDNLISS